MAFKLEEGEHVILVARRHWFRPAISTVVLIFSMLIPLIFSSVAYSIPSLSADAADIATLSIVMMLMWFFVVWHIGFIIWTNHFLNVAVITNQHIIDIEQKSLWHREISTLNLDKIQDISSRTDGFVASLLAYGDLEIQTAGSITNFIVKGVQQPDLVRQRINEQIP